MAINTEALKGMIFRIDELSALTGYHCDSIRRLIRDGALIAHKPKGSRSYMVSGDAFLAYLQGVSLDGKEALPPKAKPRRLKHLLPDGEKEG